MYKNIKICFFLTKHKAKKCFIINVMFSETTSERTCSTEHDSKFFFYPSFHCHLRVEKWSLTTRCFNSLLNLHMVL